MKFSTGSQPSALSKAVITTYTKYLQIRIRQFTLMPNFISLATQKIKNETSNASKKEINSLYPIE